MITERDQAFVRRLVREANAQTKDDGTTLWPATVQGAASPSESVSIALDGDSTTPITAQNLTGCQLGADQRVMVTLVPPHGIFVQGLIDSGDWTAFTPTLSGGWALGNSTYDAAYTQVGRLIAFYAQITIGSTATKGTGLTAALPVEAVIAPYTINARFVDTGTASYPGVVGTTTTTTAVLAAILASGTYGQNANITSTVPFTWVTGDQIFYGGFYEGAS